MRGRARAGTMREIMIWLWLYLGGFLTFLTLQLVRTWRYQLAGHELVQANSDVGFRNALILHMHHHLAVAAIWPITLLVFSVVAPGRPMPLPTVTHSDFRNSELHLPPEHVLREEAGSAFVAVNEALSRSCSKLHSLAVAEALLCMAWMQVRLEFHFAKLPLPAAQGYFLRAASGLANELPARVLAAARRGGDGP